MGQEDDRILVMAVVPQDLQKISGGLRRCQQSLAFFLKLEMLGDIPGPGRYDVYFNGLTCLAHIGSVRVCIHTSDSMCPLP